MKYIFHTIIFTYLVFGDVNIEIISTNDLHGNIAPQKAVFMNPGFPPDIIGGAGLLKYVSDCRKESDSEILIFDAGNFFQGHPYGMSDGGSSIISWMNEVGYTALVPGENDFILGQKNLNNLANQANFPFLMSNLICDNCDLKSDNIKPFLIKNISGVKVGILGIVNSGIPDLSLSINIKGVKFENSIKSINKWVDFLKNENVNTVVVLTSSGIPWDREEEYDEYNKKISSGLIDPYNMNLNAIQMGRYIENVDIVISGGVSKGYNTPWYDPYSHVYIFQNYGNGSGFGHFSLSYDSDSKIFKGYNTMIDGKIGQTLLANDFSADYESLNKINMINSIAIEKLYDFTDFKNLNENPFKINQARKSYNQWDIPKLGSDSNLDVMTWNCEFFPAAGDSTIIAMSEIINDIDVDIIAFQEIKKAAWFEKLLKTLPDYDYVISQNSSFFDQAYIYKKDLFNYIRISEPFSDNDYNFAGRPPFRLDLLVNYNNIKTPLSLINIHMKCCDSGLQRRKKASEMLYDYIKNEIDETSYLNFIVLGDWNDDLKDDPAEHCFNPFLQDEKFNFLSDLIDDNIENATYPKEPYVSFLDHIMTTSDFIDYNNNWLDVQTVFIEDYIGGYNIYEKLLSDHRPVMFSIPFTSIQ